MKKQKAKAANTSVGQKSVVAREQQAEVEFDAKHTESPLCACKDCNDAWLARRGQPLSRKLAHKKLAVDESKKDHYAKLFASHGLYLSLSGNGPSASWHLMNTAKTWGTTVGFDVDLDRILQQLSEGRPLTQIDTTFHSHQPVVATTTRNATLTGGPWCVMCGEPGGLPSPNMVGQARLLSLRLHFEPGDARLGAARLHPGRCRKRLRQLLDTAAANSQARKEAKELLGT